MDKKEYDRIYWAKFKDKYNERVKYKWATDPEFRKKRTEKKLEWVRKNKKVLKVYRHKNRKKYLRFRFEVFLRDKFTCVYCGRKPPEVILEADHIKPKSKGGKNEMDNYATSCRECNRGKGDILLN